MTTDEFVKVLRLSDEASRLAAEVCEKIATAIRERSRVIADDSAIPTLCDDCPPVGYPTDKTRCLPCPRRDTSHISAETADK